MARPNRDRTKSTIYLGEPERKAIEAIRYAYKINTDARAIRKALEIATEPLEADLTLMIEILEWADALPFKTGKDTRELRSLTARVYQLVAKSKRRSQIATKTPDLGSTSGPATAQSPSKRHR